MLNAAESAAKLRRQLDREAADALVDEEGRDLERQLVRQRDDARRSVGGLNDRRGGSARVGRPLRDSAQFSYHRVRTSFVSWSQLPVSDAAERDRTHSQTLSSRPIAIVRTRSSTSLLRQRRLAHLERTHTADGSSVGCSR